MTRRNPIARTYGASVECSEGCFAGCYANYRRLLLASKLLRGAGRGHTKERAIIVFKPAMV
jgi:hypothetical protein